MSCVGSPDFAPQSLPEFCDGLSRISLRRTLAYIGVLCSVFVGVTGLQAQSASRQLASNRPEVQQSYSVGLTLVREGRLDAAIELFEQGLEIEKQNLILLDAIGAAYSLKGDLERAKRYFLETLQVDPGFTPARKNLAITYFNAGQYESAAPELQRLLSGPGNSGPIAHLFLGIIAEKHEEYAKSVVLLEKSGSLLYQYPEALISLATSLYKLKRLETAKAVLSRLDSLPRVPPFDYFKAGCCTPSLGKTSWR